MQIERHASARPPASGGGGDLADILERVLDKGIVVAGDIAINLLDIELLTIKLRLLIASADTAKKMGIDWWESDPFLSGKASGDNGRGGLGRTAEREGSPALEERLDRIESALSELARGNGDRT